MIGYGFAPSVRIPSVCGVTSRSWTSPLPDASDIAWRAAPTATASSGFTRCEGGFPKHAVTAACTEAEAAFGPPTRSTSSIFSFGTREAQSTSVQTSIVRATRSSVRKSSFPSRVNVFVTTLDPLAVRARRDEREADLGLLLRGQRALRRLGGGLQALQGHAIAGEVDLELRLRRLQEPAHDAGVEVLAPEQRVPPRGEDLEDAVGGRLHDRDVEGSPA